MKIQHKIIEKYIPNYSKMDGETRNDAWNELYCEKVYELNAELLKIDGRGEDFLWLNEIGRGDNDITDYPDLLSFDVPWAAFQKDPENELLSNALSEQPVYVRQPPEGYENRLDGDCVRLMYKGKMHYGNLYCANHYILGLVTEEVDEWLQQRYPTEIQMNTYPTGDGAGSRRVEFTSSNEDNWEKYIEGRRKFGEFYQGIISELNKELNKKTPATYLIEGVDYDNSPTLGMICRNEATLSLVRPMTIINDMEQMKANESELEMIAKRYQISRKTPSFRSGM